MTALGCAAEEELVEEADELRIGPTPAPQCLPAQPIPDFLCNPEEPVPPPKPKNGECEIEILADWLKFDEGQGWSEGNAEVSVTYTVTDLESGDSSDTRIPGSGDFEMEVGSERTLEDVIGTFTVEEGEELDVEVCASFLEHDKGLNGKDDTGDDCTTITLTCPQPGDDGTKLGSELCRGGDCKHHNGKMSAGVKVLQADADGDCVENEDDYTPEPCDEAFKGQLCRASVVYAHYGDGPVNTLAQSLGTDYTLAMTGYDRVVLLADEAMLAGFSLSPLAFGMADVVMEPSEDAFFATLQDLTARGCDMDVWMFSHGGAELVSDPVTLAVTSEGGFVSAIEDDEHLADATVAPDITTTELLEDADPANSGTLEVPVRMTYGVPCFYQLWNQPWRSVGAKVTSGARKVSFYPNFFDNFANRWNSGQTYATSLSNEFNVADEALVVAFMTTQALAYPWGCPFVDNACAADFFVDVDLMPMVDIFGKFVDGPDEAQYGLGGPLWDMFGVPYNTSSSGVVNMRASSAKPRTGDGSIRKFVPATLTWQ